MIYFYKFSHYKISKLNDKFIYEKGYKEQTRKFAPTLTKSELTNDIGLTVGFFRIIRNNKP